MTTSYTTEQEQFWAGQFGDEYVQRNRGDRLVAANTHVFSRILARAPGVGSVVELGANIGLNLLAIRRLLPEAALSAVEINPTAVKELQTLGGVRVHQASLLGFKCEPPADLAFTKGVLIHIAPERLPEAYEALHASSRRYVLVVEYYNPAPVEVTYRGHQGRLFKRDFAGDLMERFTDLKLVDYGFVYRRDPVLPQDDLTWFLMEKR